MPTFTANQTVPAPAQAAGLSARASFTAAQQVPAPAQAATLELEDFPDVHFTAAQVVPQPTLWCGVAPTSDNEPSSTEQTLRSLPGAGMAILLIIQVPLFLGTAAGTAYLINLSISVTARQVNPAELLKAQREADRLCEGENRTGDPS